MISEGNSSGKTKSTVCRILKGQLENSTSCSQLVIPGDYLLLQPSCVVAWEKTSSQLLGTLEKEEQRKPVGFERLRASFYDADKETTFISVSKSPKGCIYFEEELVPIPETVIVGIGPSCIKLGALGCLSIPIVESDLHDIKSNGQIWFPIPSIWKIKLIGDCIWTADKSTNFISLLERIFSMQSSYFAVEFSGSGCAAISIPERLKICDICSHFGAISCLFPTDDVTWKFYGNLKDEIEQTLDAFDANQWIKGKGIERLEQFLREPSRLKDASDTSEDSDVILVNLDTNLETETATGWMRLGHFDVRLAKEYAYNEKPFSRCIDSFPPVAVGFVMVCPENNISSFSILEDPTRCYQSEEELAAATLKPYDAEFRTKLIPCTQPQVLVVGFNFGTNSWYYPQVASCFKALGFRIIIGGSFSPDFFRHALNEGLLLLKSPKFVEFLQQTDDSEASSVYFDILSSSFPECHSKRTAFATKCQIKIDFHLCNLFFPVHHHHQEALTFP
eukprot:jgi/Galph1/1970/GphlegSOOS_G662.1